MSQKQKIYVENVKTAHKSMFCYRVKTKKKQKGKKKGGSGQPKAKCMT